MCLTGAACARRAMTTWTAFTSPDGDFSVSAPGELVPDPQDASNPHPEGIPRVRFHLTAANNTYRVYFAVERLHFPEGSISAYPERALDGARDMAISFVHGQLLKESRITLEGSPGREIRVMGSGGKALARQRMYIVKDYLYITFAVSASEAEEETVGRFMDSLHINNK